MINEKQTKKFCKEDISKIKNYDKAIADTTQTWHCHHMTETWWNCSKQDLIDNECYYNRKACELIFLTPAEHMRIHMKERTGEKNPFYGKHHSEESRKKIAECMICNKHMKGKHHSEESRKKIAETLKGRKLSEETRKKVSVAMKGKTLSEETRRKLSEAAKRQWALKKESINERK